LWREEDDRIYGRGKRQWDVKDGDGETHRTRSTSVSGRRGREASLTSSPSTAALHSERLELSGGRSTGVFVMVLETLDWQR
jgi:hypothetical protein